MQALKLIQTVLTKKDEDGKMRATAAWYLSKIDFPNAVQYELLECSVHPPYPPYEGLDMRLWIKLKGEFVKVMEERLSFRGLSLWPRCAGFESSPPSSLRRVSSRPFGL